MSNAAASTIHVRRFVLNRFQFENFYRRFNRLPKRITSTPNSYRLVRGTVVE
jgi:hypothetical protein